MANLNNKGPVCLKAALVLVVAYVFTFLYFFLQTPLGMTPVLDGAENIQLADQIFTGTLAREPFYRAMVYPAFLSLFRLAGFTIEELHPVAITLGIICHVIISLLVALIAQQIWQNAAASCLALLLYGFYPPAIHFAAEPMDITPALLFLTISITLLFKAIASGRTLTFAASGLMLGIGAAIRTNLLPAAGVFALLALRGKDRKNMVIAMIFVCLPILMTGLANYLHSGRFMLMPWQGSFNLYSANSPEANGKYFKQQVLLPDRDFSRNPSRMESELIYFNADVAVKPAEIDDFNSFWRRKTFAAISQNPQAWLTLNVKKLYFLVNNFEQYNNKTFSFHKQLSPVLRYNPLCFGLILVFAVIALFNSATTERHSIMLQTITLLAAGICIFYVSDRFRLQLLPLLLPLSAGIATLNPATLITKKNMLILLFTSLITFTGFFEAADTSTFKADRLLLSHACARLGMYEEQVNHADMVLKEEPENIQAIRLKLVGFSNLAMSGQISDSASWATVAKELDYLENNGLQFHDTRFIAGCYAHTVKNNPQTAKIHWEKGLQSSKQPDLILAAMLLAGSRKADENMIKMAESSPFLRLALDLDAGKTPQSTNEPTLKSIKFLLNINL